MAPYVSLEALHADLRDHGDAHVYGQSVEGRDLVAYTVGEGPRHLITAGLHGLEYIGCLVAQQVLHDGPIEGMQLVVCPVLNPDGYARTWAQNGDAPVGSLRKNARGVDLNRNFPKPLGRHRTLFPFAGSASPRAATYRGPQPLSEPESHHLVSFLTELQPHASANLHSFMGTLITPPVSRWSDWRTYSTLSSAFRRGQASSFGYPRLATPIGDVFTGELEDWQHHEIACWATCIECFSLRESFAQHRRAPTSFWRFNPRQPAPIVARDAPGVRAWLTAARDHPRPHRNNASPPLLKGPAR